VSPGTSARLFVALDLPASAREALALPPVPSLRPVAADALHVTLAFLGHLPESSIASVEEAAFSGLEGLAAPRLSLTAWKGVPPRRPRLFAVDLSDEDGRCAALAAAVQGGLIASSLYEPEKRPFWPHVTVARVRAREKPPRVDSLPDLPDMTFAATDVVLYRSRLARSGARYEVLARRSLGS
jgi:RNA 2',3'-cyclic 3'-phosphodiesterase